MATASAPQQHLRLYHFARSSAAYRVRIALALKGLAAELVPVHLLKNEHLKPPFADLAPTGLVPVLDDAGRRLTQSLAIVEYLDETHPEPPLLPGDALARARIRALALAVACEIHPLNNLRVLRYLVRELKLDTDAKDRWSRHWMETGLAAVESQLAGSPDTGRFCHGDTPTLADVLLVPQVVNARRMACALDRLPTVSRIADACLALDAFARTHPSAFPEEGT